jgi:hypothetical protein
MPEYTFDVSFSGRVRVRAENIDQAQEALGAWGVRSIDQTDPKITEAEITIAAFAPVPLEVRDAEALE